MSQTYMAIITYLVGYGCWVIVVMNGDEESEGSRKRIPDYGRVVDWKIGDALVVRGPCTRGKLP